MKKIKQFFDSLKLRQKVRTLFICILMIYVFIFSSIYIGIIRPAFEKSEEQYNYNTMVSVCNNLTNEISTISVMSRLIMSNHAVRDYLNCNELSKVSSKAYQAVESIYQIETSFSNIDSVYIFRQDGLNAGISNRMTNINTDIMEQQPWIEQVEEKAGGYVIQIDGNGAFKLANGRHTLTFARVINDIQTQKPLGILVINCSFSILENSFSELAQDGLYFSYVTDQGEILSTEDIFRKDNSISSYIKETSETFEHFKVNAGHNLYYYKDVKLPVSLICLEKVSFYRYFSMQSVGIGVFFLIITLLSLFIIDWYITKQITTPVEKLVKSMDATKEGWLKRVGLNLPNDEIGQLKNSYNSMLIEINKLISELVEKEKDMNQAKMDIMLEQIKPHFLYNILENIGYLSLEGEKDKVYDAIVTLGDFYRRFLNRGSDENTIEEEIYIVKDYLKLQNLRFHGAITAKYDIEDDIKKSIIPKLILQPLIENSIYHGINPKGEAGEIVISAKKKNGNLVLKIYDNGVGMDDETIYKCFHHSQKSFGLKRTIERLQHFSGREDIYSIHSKVGYYCEIVLEIPVRLV